MYSVNDIENIQEDLKEKIKACSEVGLGDLSHSFNEALNLIDWLWDEHKRVFQTKIFSEGKKDD